MIQTSPALPLAAGIPSATKEDDPLDPLLRLAGDLHTVRALVIADCGLDLLCGLLRRGCRAATTIRFGGKPDAHDYDLVIVSPRATTFSADRLIQRIRCGLAPTGRLLACIPNRRAATGFIRRLRLYGFAVLPPIHLPNLTVLRAELRTPP